MIDLSMSEERRIDRFALRGTRNGKLDMEGEGEGDRRPCTVGCTHTYCLRIFPKLTVRAHYWWLVRE